MARQCRSRANQNPDSAPDKCSKCNKIGHKIEDCKMNVKCYACGKFGHMANQCTSRNFTGFGKAIQKNNVTCYACNEVGHIPKFCRRRNPPVGNRGSNDKGKEKVSEIQEDHTQRWVRKTEEQSSDGNVLVTYLAE